MRAWRSTPPGAVPTAKRKIFVAAVETTREEDVQQLTITGAVEIVVPKGAFQRYIVFAAFTGNF